VGDLFRKTFEWEGEEERAAGIKTWGGDGTCIHQGGKVILSIQLEKFKAEQMRNKEDKVLQEKEATLTRECLVSKAKRKKISSTSEKRHPKK